MATSSDEDSFERSDELNKYDAELDFSSPNFNPERALFADTISVPYPEIKSFTSLNIYQNAIEKRRQVRRQNHSESDIKNNKRTAATNQDEKNKQTIHQVQQSLNISHKQSAHSTTCKSLLVESDKHSTLTKTCPNSGEKKSNAAVVAKSSLPTKRHTKVSTDHTKQPGDISQLTTSEEIAEQKYTEKHGDVIGSASTSKTQSSVTKRNVFARMENVEGPLTFLRRCVEERLLVRVVTRGAVLVRGVCRGYVVAFDKYFNMAMIDVDEIYRRPPRLGKVRARRSHKMQSAKKVLLKEREEYQGKWKEEQNALAEDVSKASNSMQALNLLSSLFNSSINQPKSICAPISTLPFNQQEDVLTSKPAVVDRKEDRTKKTVVKTTQPKLVKLQSVYEGIQAPFSFFEREALLLGIPDENVKIRHVNQLFIRGDNVVSVSIVVEL